VNRQNRKWLNPSHPAAAGNYPGLEIAEDWVVLDVVQVSRK
jgi:hypothetical protein